MTRVARIKQKEDVVGLGSGKRLHDGGGCGEGVVVLYLSSFNYKPNIGHVTSQTLHLI